MRIVYIITKIIAYPGAFLNGFFEHLACRILKIEVTEANYLSPDWHCGHVKHEEVNSAGKAFLFTLLPYLAQRALGWIFFAASFAPLLLFGLRSNRESSFFFLYIVALFFGLSMLCNAFPQWEHARRQWQLFYGKDAKQAGGFARVVLAPCNAWFVAGAWLERHGIPTIVAQSYSCKMAAKNSAALAERSFTSTTMGMRK